jgi:hypothetical protein
MNQRNNQFEVNARARRRKSAGVVITAMGALNDKRKRPNRPAVIESNRHPSVAGAINLPSAGGISREIPWPIADGRPRAGPDRTLAVLRAARRKGSNARRSSLKRGRSWPGSRPASRATRSLTRKDHGTKTRSHLARTGDDSRIGGGRPGSGRPEQTRACRAKLPNVESPWGWSLAPGDFSALTICVVVSQESVGRCDVIRWDRPNLTSSPSGRFGKRRGTTRGQSLVTGGLRFAGPPCDNLDGALR